MADEITKPQDKQTSAGDSETTSEETPTLTITQARAMSEKAEKAKNDALSEVGRMKKAFDDALRRLKEREEADLRREEEAVMDDPDKLSVIRERRASARKLAEAEAKVTELQAQTQEVLEMRAERLSEKYSVDQKVLLKYGGTTKESMEELAKTFGERKTTEDKPKIRVTSPPDSGKTIGGDKGLTLKDVTKMSPEERNLRNKEIANLPFF